MMPTGDIDQSNVPIVDFGAGFKCERRRYFLPYFRKDYEIWSRMTASNLNFEEKKIVAEKNAL